MKVTNDLLISNIFIWIFQTHIQVEHKVDSRSLF